MKTFEERYTEWIDGQLTGNDLTAFEGELARRSAVGEAQADKKNTLALRGLLRENLNAPALSNADFFSHQLRERIQAERAQENRPKAAKTVVQPYGWFGGPLTRLAWVGAAGVFVAMALYYGMVPSTTPAPSPTVAAARANPPSAVPQQPVAVTAPAPAQVAEATSPAAPVSGDQPKTELMVKNEFASLAPLPPDIQASAPDDAFSVTPMNYKVPNKNQSVQVLWLSGLNYLPDLSAPEQNNAAPAPGTPAPVAP